MRTPTRYILALLPAVLCAGLLVLLWPLTVTATGGDITGAALGWLCILFLVSSTLTMLMSTWTCAEEKNLPHPVVPLFPALSELPASTPARTPGRIPAARYFRYSVVADSLGLLLLGVSFFAHPFTLIAACKVYCILASWCALWSAFAAFLRPLGTGIAIGLPLMGSMLTFGGPVTLRPLVRIATEYAPSLQPLVIKTIAVTTPMLAVLDGVKDSFGVSWETLPEMYRLSGLGQDVPMDLPHWWATTLLYGTAGLLFSLFASWRSAR